MEVIIRSTAEEAAKLTAKVLAAAISRKPSLRLGLATGATMESVYAELAAMNQSGEVDFSKVHTFNLDEYVGLSPEDPNSYRYYMNHHLFDRINIDIRNTNLPDGLASDEAAEGDRYEHTIRNAGGIDLQLLGIGNNGHVGFNEPTSSFRSRTRAISLTPETYRQNCVYFTPPETMPRRAFSMGVGTILDATHLVMLVTGKKKAGIVAKAVEGPLTAMISGSALQLHPNALVILDEAAASELTQTEYYHWAFDSDPKWESYR